MPSLMMFVCQVSVLRSVFEASVKCVRLLCLDCIVVKDRERDSECSCMNAVMFFSSIDAFLVLLALNTC